MRPGAALFVSVRNCDQIHLNKAIDDMPQSTPVGDECLWWA